MAGKAGKETEALMNAKARTWKIGDLARATGLTVRTLHHYHQLGLLSPASRTDGGHRCYTDADVRRLHQIVALRSLGISLGEIGLVLDGRDEVVDLLRRQLGVADERIHQAVALRARVLSVLQCLNRRTDPSTEELLALIEEAVVMNAPLTPDRLVALQQARERYVSELSDTEFEALQQKMKRTWESLSAEERELRRAALAAARPRAEGGR
jgi:MerR family transcriptional regulator, thiopeptide resistance regulator